MNSPHSPTSESEPGERRQQASQNGIGTGTIMESCAPNNGASANILSPMSPDADENVSSSSDGPAGGGKGERIKRSRKSDGSINHAHCHSNTGIGGVGSLENADDAENGLSGLNDLELEAYHFHKIVATFKLYKKLSLDKLRRTEQYVKSLPSRHQEFLQEYVNHQSSLRNCVEVNQNLFQLFVHEQTSLFENQDEFYPSGRCLRPVEQQITSLDFERLQAILKHIVRDWSDAGEKERSSCYKLILSEIEAQFPENRESTRVLVPGAGLGRLAYEIVRLGYETQGNEFSLLMLFASNFILNKCNGRNLYKCYPWIHQSTNVLHHEDQLKEVMFPDVNPTSLCNPNAKFSMTAGDFLDVYAKSDQVGSWDCIVTCFFVDCAHNIVEFLELIYNCLKENGVWINLGPLLYHYSDIPNENSIEPSYDFVISIAKKMGFTVLKEVKDLPTYYTENSRSMLNYSYKSVFVVCKKVLNVENEDAQEVL